MSRMPYWAIVVLVTAMFPRPASAAEPAKRAKESPQAVYLHGGRDFTLQFGSQTYVGLLARELARQALLIAARDELSYVTHDLHLGQVVPKDGCVELDFVGIAGRPSKLELLSGAPPFQSLIAWEGMKTGEEVDLAWLVVEMESRSRGSFVKHLKSADLHGEPRAWSDAATVSPEVVAMMSEMNFVTQFYAACRLHGEIARHGQCPTVLGALAMVYANLGVLTEYHWAPAHEVFTARSLLYAQRLMASGRTPPLALTARAYAFALAGLPATALADLDALVKLSPDGKTAEQLALPTLLQAYCRFQFENLKAEKYEKSLAELATLLGFLARAFARDDDRMYETGVSAQEAIPHCYRINAKLAENPGVGLGHSVTTIGPVATARTLYPRLLRITELPANVRLIAQSANGQPDNADEASVNVVAEFKIRAELIAALAESLQPISGQEELTWPVLARLIAEHSFAEIARRTQFLRYSLGVSADEWLDAARPVYKNNPYAPVLEALRVEGVLAQRGREKAMMVDLDVSEMQADLLGNVAPPDPALKYRQHTTDATHDRHVDATVPDLSRLLVSCKSPAKVVALLYKLCPDSPKAQAGMVRYNWPLVEKEQDVWLPRGEKIPEILVAFSENYVRLKQLDKAEEVLKKVCQVEPTFAHFKSLAVVYKRKGQMKEWQSALEEAMKQPSFGLEHAEANNEIAQYYADRREWKTALPFAEEAAQSYSEWGLQRAATCHEALQNWEEAEKFYRAAATRYQTTAWFYFTKRTGQGDRRAALAHVKGLLSGNEPLQNGPLIPNVYFYFALATDDIAGATKVLETNKFADFQALLFALHLALLYDEQQEGAKRDAVLNQTMVETAQKENKKNDPVYPLRELTKLFIADLAKGGKCEFDADVINSLRMSPQLKGRFGWFDYMLGRYYELHGKADKAKPLYLACIRLTAVADIYQSLTGIRLLAMGVKPSEYKESMLHLSPDDVPPK